MNMVWQGPSFFGQGGHTAILDWPINNKWISVYKFYTMLYNYDSALLFDILPKNMTKNIFIIKL